MFDIRNHGGVFGGGVSKSKDILVRDTNLGGTTPNKSFVKVITNDYAYAYDYGPIAHVDKDGYVYHYKHDNRTLTKVEPSTRVVIDTYVFSSAISSILSAATLHFDDDNKKIYMMMYNTSSPNNFYLSVYNMNSKTGFTVKGGSTLFQSSYRSGVILAGNKVLVFANTGVYIFNDKNSLTNSSLPDTSIAGSIIPYNFYYDGNDVIYIAEQLTDNTVYIRTFTISTLTLSARLQNPLNNSSTSPGLPSSLTIADKGSTLWFVTNTIPRKAMKVKVTSPTTNVVEGTWVIPSAYDSVSTSNTISNDLTVFRNLKYHGLCLFMYEAIIRLNDNQSFDVVYDNMYSTAKIISLGGSYYIEKYGIVYNCMITTYNTTTRIATYLIDRFKLI